MWGESEERVRLPASDWYPSKPFCYDYLEMWQGQEICPAGTEVSKGDGPFCVLAQRKWNRILKPCGVGIPD